MEVQTLVIETCQQIQYLFQTLLSFLHSLDFQIIYCLQILVKHTAQKKINIV